MGERVLLERFSGRGQGRTVGWRERRERSWRRRGEAEARIRRFVRRCVRMGRSRGRGARVGGLDAGEGWGGADWREGEGGRAAVS